MVNFSEILKIRNLQSNSVTRKSLLTEQKLVKNVKIGKFKYDILSDFQTMWMWISFQFPLFIVTIHRWFQYSFAYKWSNIILRWMMQFEALPLSIDISHYEIVVFCVTWNRQSRHRNLRPHCRLKCPLTSPFWRFLLFSFLLWPCWPFLLLVWWNAKFRCESSISWGW